MLQNRIVIITGGAGGVGQTVTLRWLQEGASVLIVSHSQRGMDEVQDAWERTVGADPKRLAVTVADVATADGAAATVTAAQSAFGQPADTLLHLVGGFAQGAVDAPDAPEQWDRMMSLNLTSAFHCYRAVLPALRARGGGWIVGLASRTAVSPPANLAAYAASKAGLIALTQSLSAEVKAENIHANVILASTIDTPANRAAMGDKAAEDWVSADDIADATLYLCSDRARAVHGATLEIYGKV